MLFYPPPVWNFLQTLVLKSFLHWPKFFSAFGPPIAKAELAVIMVVATTAVTNVSAATIANIESVVFEFICEECCRIQAIRSSPDKEPRKLLKKGTIITLDLLLLA